VVDGVIHYCVANMPGGVARTSTQALTNATLEHAVAIANQGIRQAMLRDGNLRNGLNVCGGSVTCEAVAQELGHPYVAAEKALAAID
jgi:alanine dehydrogenase